MRIVHIVLLAIREEIEGRVHFLFLPMAEWPGPEGEIFISLPAKKSVDEPMAEFIRGQSLEAFVDETLRDWLGTPPERYAIEQELPLAAVECVSLGRKIPTRYEAYPVNVWVHPDEREALRERSGGRWLTPEQALAEPLLFGTARAAIEALLAREKRLNLHYTFQPAEETRPEAPRRLLTGVDAEPGMDALAKRWFMQNKGGVRYLSRGTIEEILDAGDRAFNLRVADPYLRYQMQGVGYTWSFFTHKDGQDIHVHSAPTVEIYGVIDGEMEIWWKAYHDRGTSDWSHQVLGPGDWIEVEALQCHVIHWRTEGRGVVFKAGPGPLAGVGRLGQQGKTPCDRCPCMIAPEVAALATRKAVEFLKADYETAGLEFVSRILDENSRRLSRTRGGSSDTASSAEKLPLLQEGEELRARSAENEARVHRFLYETRNDPLPRAATEAKALLFRIADLVNEDLLPEGRFRTWPIDAPRDADGEPVGKPKLAPGEISGAIEVFCAAIAARRDEPNPAPLAAMAEWELNGGILHPFYDGCSRISRAFSAMILIRSGAMLPLYDDAATYFQRGNAGADSFRDYMRERMAACAEELGA